MLIHLALPTPKYETNLPLYKNIVKIIKHHGHRLTSDIENDALTYIEMAEREILDLSDMQLLCKREQKRLSAADALIADGTDKATFGVGYEVALALTSSKPVLILLQDDSVGGSFISGLEHPLLHRAVFNRQNIEGVLGEFFATLKVETT